MSDINNGFQYGATEATYDDLEKFIQAIRALDALNINYIVSVWTSAGATMTSDATGWYQSSPPRREYKIKIVKYPRLHYDRIDPDEVHKARTTNE